MHFYVIDTDQLDGESSVESARGLQQVSQICALIVGFH